MYHLLPLTMFYTVLSHDVTATVLLLSKLYQTTCSYYCYSYIANLLQFKSNYSSIAIAFTIATPITMLLQFRSNYWSAATTATTAASATATVAIQIKLLVCYYCEANHCRSTSLRRQLGMQPSV